MSLLSFEPFLRDDIYVCIYHFRIRLSQTFCISASYADLSLSKNFFSRHLSPDKTRKSHLDGVVIENNIIRNLGYEGCDMWGIYLDDGAYNCTVRRNLVYNMWPGEYALTSRYVESCERSNINNFFEDNIFIGACKIAGNRKGLGRKAIIRHNYICGQLDTQGNEYVQQFGNKFVKARVKADGKIQIDRKPGVKKRNYTDDISKLISLINM